jgi:DNA-binding NarL/FixJ family response regulator
MLRIVVVSDHDVAREGMASVLEGEFGLEVVAALGYSEDLVGRIALASADVVVLDHSPPRGDAVALFRALSESGIDARVVLLVDRADIHSIDLPPDAEVGICLPKDVRSDTLAVAVREGLLRETQSPAENEALPTLGRSHVAVLRLLVDGRSVADIAEAMALSEHTVRSYIRVIYRKLGVGSRTEAAAVAVRLRLL